MDDVEHVAGVTSERVEPSDDQLGTGAEELDDGCQFGPALTRAARNFFGADEIATFGIQASDSYVEVLVQGRCAGLPNADHSLSPQGSR